MLGEVAHQTALNTGKSREFKAVVGRVSWVGLRNRKEGVGPLKRPPDS